MSYGAPRQMPTPMTDQSDEPAELRNCDGPTPTQPRMLLMAPSPTG
jgi:hypothetical protein